MTAQQVTHKAFVFSATRPFNQIHSVKLCNIPTVQLLLPTLKLNTKVNNAGGCNVSEISQNAIETARLLVTMATGFHVPYGLINKKEEHTLLTEALFRILHFRWRINGCFLLFSVQKKNVTNKSHKSKNTNKTTETKATV